MQINKLTQLFAVAAVATAQNLAYTTLTENGTPVATYPTNYDPSTAPSGAVLTTVSRDGSAVATYPIGSAATSYIPNTDATMSGSSSMMSDNAPSSTGLTMMSSTTDSTMMTSTTDSTMMTSTTDSSMMTSTSGSSSESSASSPTSTVSAASTSNAGSAVTPLAAMGGIMGVGLAAVAMI